MAEVGSELEEMELGKLVVAAAVAVEGVVV